MFVVNFMCFSDSPEIDVVGAFKPIETLVDKNIVHQEVTYAVGSDAEPHPYAPVISSHHTKHDEQPGRNGENQKEYIIFFKKSWLVLVMVAVKIPAQAVHHKLVCDPGHKFHKEKCGEKNDKINNEH
jgi:hypothetical protein